MFVYRNRSLDRESGCWAVGRVYIDLGGVEEEVSEEGVESMSHISVVRDWLCYAGFRYICASMRRWVGRQGV
jgi:hypothetical protein